MKPSPDPRIPLATALAAAILLAAGLFGVPGLALADVPNATDIATCNREAQERVRGLAGPPTSKDEAGADAARKGTSKVAEHPGHTATGTQSSDPQIHGMGSEGAKDATYRAAYRVCMRRAGF
jgi:hypothetical protein